MNPTSLYPADNPFAIQKMDIPRKGCYKIIVPEDYEMVVCESKKESECLGSGRLVEIKGRRQPSGELFWIPQKPQTITYFKDDYKIQITVRFFNSTQLINNSTTTHDLRTMLKPLNLRIDGLIADHTTENGLRKSIEATAQGLVEPMGLRLVGEVKIELIERRS